MANLSQTAFMLAAGVKWSTTPEFQGERIHRNHWKAEYTVIMLQHKRPLEMPAFNHRNKKGLMVSSVIGSEIFVFYLVSLPSLQTSVDIWSFLPICPFYVCVVFCN